MLAQSNQDSLVCIIFFWCLWAAVGAIIGQVARNQALGGVALGVLLGPLGWLAVLLMPDARKKCLQCGGRLPDTPVVKCMHCGSDVIPSKPA